MKHTPGPWVYRYTAKQDGNGGSFEHSVVHYRNEFPYNETSDEYISRHLTQANAHLIAAAPDMLAALKYWFDSKADPKKLTEMAQAAIAKAEGRDDNAGREENS